MNIKKYIGNRSFYRMILAVTLPIMAQNGISTFVSLLDNLMVGRLGNESMSGVSIVNQFLFIFNLLIFGAVAAGGIYMAQFHGSGDRQGECHTFRFKFLSCLLVGILGIVILGVFQNPLIGLFLQGASADVDPVLTLSEGKAYLNIMLTSLIPFAIANVYASSMRETNDTVTPMVASIVSVGINFVLNYLLIFGHLGIPRLGVRGAAIATVIARVAELLVLIVRTHSKKERYPFIIGAYRSLKIPKTLAGQIFLRGLPLMLNELFWSLAVTLSNQCYSTLSLDVVPAQSIHTTLFNVFSVVYMSMGTAVSIIVGNLLGAGKLEEARDTDRKMIVFSVFCGCITGGAMAGFSHLFPLLYNTTDAVRSLAAYMLIVSGAIMPFSAFTNAAYFTIRSGGKVLLTVLFDSVYMWTVLMPLVYFLSRYTDISIYPLFALGQGTEVVKSVLGFFMLRRGSWVRRLVPQKEKTQ